MKIISTLFLLQEAMAKDILERSTEPDLNLKSYLADAYLHPIFQTFEIEETELVAVRVDKQQTHVAIPEASEPSSPSPANYVHHPPSPPQYVYQPPSPPHYGYNQSSSPPHYGYNLSSPPCYYYHNDEH